MQRRLALKAVVAVAMLSMLSGCGPLGKLSSGNGATFANQARQEVIDKNFGLAKRNIEKAIQIDPNVASRHGSLAGILREEGDINGAATEYARACDLDPSDAAAWANFSILQYDRGLYREAEKDATQATHVNQYDAYGWYHLAKAEFKLREYGLAVLAANRALQIDPSWAGAQVVKGRALYALGRKAEARVAWDAGSRADDFYGSDAKALLADPHFERW